MLNWGTRCSRRLDILSECVNDARREIRVFPDNMRHFYKSSQKVKKDSQNWDKLLLL